MPDEAGGPRREGRRPDARRRRSRRRLAAGRATSWRRRLARPVGSRGVRGDGRHHGLARPQGRRRGERGRRRPGPGRQVGDLGFPPRVRRRVLPDVARVRRPPGPVVHGLLAQGSGAGSDRDLRPRHRHRHATTTTPTSIGRVKVKFPWLGDDVESWWARIAAPGAGPDYGIVWVPQVNDEVLVGFEHGDVRHAVRARRAVERRGHDPVRHGREPRRRLGDLLRLQVPDGPPDQLLGERRRLLDPAADQGRRDRDHARRAELRAEDQGPGQGRRSRPTATWRSRPGAR